MVGSRALVLSVFAHGVALAAIVSWFDEREPQQVHEADPPIVIEIVAPTPRQEIEVALIDDTPASSAAAPARLTARVGAVRAGAMPGRAPEDIGEPGEPATEPGRPNPFAMRGMRHDLTLSEEAAARSLGPERPREERAKPTGKIAAAGREGRIDDAVATFRVHGDGTVDITDKKDIDWRWRVPLPTPSRILKGAKELGEDLAAWREDPYRDTRVGKMQDLPKHLQAVPDQCGTFGDEMCDASDPETGVHRKPRIERSLSRDGFIIPVIGGKTDITGYLYRKFAGDPYASRKLKLLDDTRAERAQSGAAYRTKQLAHSAELMANNLTTLWTTVVDPAARREALFELWDECAEGDGEPGEAGARARAMVVGWIGARLPRGGEGAFTDDDITRLDHKRASQQHFAPYQR